MWFVVVPLIILSNVPMAFCKLTHTMHMMLASKCHSIQQQGAILRYKYHRKQQRKKFLKARCYES
jgi:hypothetical protein